MDENGLKLSEDKDVPKDLPMVESLVAILKENLTLLKAKGTGVKTHHIFPCLTKMN